MLLIKQYCCFKLRECQKHLFVIVLLSVFVISSFSQYRFDSWTTDNGLPQSSVNSITQTKDGFLWFTTFGGLVRYDGLRFQVFNSGNTKGLKSGRFTFMTEDNESNLWIATEGQGITRYKDGNFTTYSTENEFSDNKINRFDSKPNQNFLLSVGDKTLKWDGNNFVNYLPPINEPTTSILERKPNGAIWYFEDSHLRKFENGQITVDFKPDFVIYRSFEDSQGRVWLAGNQDELFMLKDGKLTTYSEKDGFPKCRFLNALEDKSGRILFATPLGLLIFENGKFSHFTTEDGLVDNKANNLYQDREGTIWIGTSSGLSRLTQAAITPYSTKNGLSSDNVYSIFQDRRGKIWIGSWMGLTIYENGIFQDVSETFGVANENITAIYEDNQENIWITTWAGKVVRMDNGGKITTLNSNEQLGTHIRAIHHDRKGKMWFGTNKGIIFLENGKFTTANILSDKTIFAIHEDRSGQLWIGSNKGLSKLKDNILTTFTETDGISDNIVRAIYEDKEGTLWIGMYDSGLYRYKSGQFTHYSTNEGLFDNGAFQIIEDNSGHFWISCNLGIYRIKKSELNDFADGRISKITSIPYNKRDGMLNSECNGGSQPAGILARDGRIWFPTQKGVAVINPDSIQINKQPPPVVIESIIVDTKPVNIHSPIKLQPEETNLEIHYSGLSFINPELVKFKYKLEGLDTDWTDAASRRTAYYSHLPPGTYNFKVIAANRDGVWNEQGISLNIEVLPPFWRTGWFLVLSILAVILSAYAFYRRRTGMLKKAKATQEAFSLQLIASQEEERKRIAVELHDSLGQSLVLIKNWASLGIKATNGNVPKTNLNEISEAASEAINEVREIAYNLGPYQLDRLGLKTSIEEMIQKVSSSSPIKFEIEIDKIDGFFDKPTEINIFRILQEAVNNIVKHSEATKANLSIKMDLVQMTVSISDNGKGFVYENTDLKPQSGLGLFGMAERVNLLKGEYSIKSEQGYGTTVTINLPFGGLQNG